MTGRRVAMVTGATGGLGRVLVPDLAADGWDLVLVGSSQQRLDALVAEGFVVDPPRAAMYLWVALGLDRPVWEQFGRILWSTVQGDLGRSFVFG